MKKLTLPKPQGKNKAFDWLKSYEGMTWLRSQVSNLIKIGITRNGKAIAYIQFQDAIFVVYFASNFQRNNHLGVTGPYADKYRSGSPSELGLILTRFDYRVDNYGRKQLVKKNYEAFIEL